MWENDPLGRFVIYFFTGFSIVGIIMTISFIVLGIWKFIELIS